MEIESYNLLFLLFETSPASVKYSINFYYGDWLSNAT